MVTEMMSHMTVNTHILDDDKYKLIFSVEEVNRLTLSGVPFRDAYKQVGLSIEASRTAKRYTIHMKAVSVISATTAYPY